MAYTYVDITDIQDEDLIEIDVLADEFGELPEDDRADILDLLDSVADALGSNNAFYAS